MHKELLFCQPPSYRSTLCLFVVQWGSTLGALCYGHLNQLYWNISLFNSSGIPFPQASRTELVTAGKLLSHTHTHLEEQCTQFICISEFSGTSLTGTFPRPCLRETFVKILVTEKTLFKTKQNKTNQQNLQTKIPQPVFFVALSGAEVWNAMVAQRKALSDPK